MRLDLAGGTDLEALLDSDLAALGWAAEMHAGACRTEYWYDTPGFALLRWGVTLRRLDSDDWCLRVPPRAGASARQMTMRQNAVDPPQAIMDVIRPLVRGWDLQDVLATEVVTRRVEFLDGQERLPVALTYEVRRALGGPGLGRTLTQAVVRADARVTRQRIEGILREKGARDGLDPAVRLLGSAAQAPPDLVIPSLGPKATAGQVVQAAWVRDVLELIFRLAGVPLDEDIEDVHRARVLTRRLRGTIRGFERLFRVEAMASLADELAWLAGELGPVRDADVMGGRLVETASLLPPDERASGKATIELLADQRQRLWQDLVEALRSPRCEALLDDLVLLGANGLPFAVEADGKAKVVLGSCTRRHWRRLKRRVEKLPSEPGEADLHRVRIAAKYVRYACETSALCAGRPAMLLADRIGVLQEVLGAHQDAVVLRGWLREVARQHPALGLASSELAGIESARMVCTSQNWRPAWDRLDRKRYRRWL